MKIQTENGLLDEAQLILSPNFDNRPPDCPVCLLVIHNITLPPGKFGGPYINQFFCNQLDSTAHPFFETIQHLHVSAHLLIQRNGDIVQYVPFHKRAWHAGKSQYGDRTNCNDFSIGIEMEGTDDTPYEEAQYRALARTTQVLMATYPSITPNNITGHCHIAPGRKTDPGAYFDWVKYQQLITDR